MEIDIKLISLKRFLIIGLTGAVLVPVTALFLKFNYDVSIEIFFGTLIIGILLIIIIISLTTKYRTKIFINPNSIKIGSSNMIYWDQLESYDYDESPLFGKLKLRTNQKQTYSITGSLKGVEGEKFAQVVNAVTEKIAFENSIRPQPKIRVRNFYNSKFAKPTGFVFILATIILTVWVLLKSENIKSTVFLRLGGLYLIVIYLLNRIFIQKQ